MKNEEIADHLDRIADLLDTQDGNPFRIRSYRKAANAIRGRGESVAQAVRQGGEDAAREIEGVGESLGRLIAEYVDRGRTRLYDRLAGETGPEKLFMQVPGIGEDLAHRIVEKLDIHTLEELEQAAHDGDLSKVEGFGKKRVEGVKSSLAGMLSQSAQRRQRERESPGKQEHDEPSIETLLDVDREYREKAAAGSLRTIAPKRFNPEGEAWLPILHTDRGQWDFTALFSNTKRAHDLDKVEDWVVLYFECDGTESQRTVVTETRGALEGKRVVRGRERDCKDYYESRV